MFEGVRTVIYHVEDLQKAKEWYTKLLGFPPYFDQPFYVGFDVGGYEFGLHPENNGLKIGNNVVAYWGVKDAKKAFESAQKAGATAHAAPQDVGEGIIVAAVKDPFGNILGIIENPHFKGKKG